jgi:imidazolonepropionase-like amidohydrolase
VSVLGVACGIAFLSGSNPPPPPPPRTPVGDSACFTIYKLQHEVGSETSTSSPVPGGLEIVTRWAFRYLGTDVRLEETLETSARGSPLRLKSHGQTSTLTDVDLSIEIGGARATVRDRGATRTMAAPREAFPVHHYPPVAIEEALFRFWLTRGRPSSLPLLPAGTVSFELRGSDTLPLTTGSVVTRRYAVSGLVWGRQSLWATTDGRIVAVVNGDAELDRFEAVRGGFESQLPRFVRGAVADGLEDLQRLAHRVHPVRTGDYAILGAKLIDGTGAPPLDDAAVLVRDGRIAAIGPRASIAIPGGMPVVDARGKTMIPGLWDMHVHFEQVEWPAAQLAAGVTTARDVGNELELAVGLRDAIKSGRALGPRMLLAGLIDGAPDGLGVQLAGTPDEARAMVARYQGAGFQQIKIYQSVPPPLVSVIAAEAHRLGMTVTGHVPTGMNAFQFVDAGADQINHIGFVLAVMTPPPQPGQPRAPVDLATPEAQRAVAFLLAHHTVLDPTLARSEENAHPKDSTLSAYEPGAAKAPPELAEVLNASGSPGDVATRRMAGLARALPIVNALRQAGIPIVTGTDLVVPGHSIARELELEVKGGFTPMEALQAATIVAARVMGLDGESGTVEPGKRADLVLLEGDPLADIREVRHVHAVVTEGRMYLPAPLWRSVGFAP